MKYLAIAELLKAEFSADVLSINNPDVSAVKFYDREEPRFERHEMYVGSYQDLTRCESFGGEDVCYIIYNVPEKARSELYNSNTVIVGAAQTISAVNMVMDLLMRESQHANVESMAQIFEVDNLNSLVNCLAEQLQNPVFLMDLQWHVLVSSDQKSEQEDLACCTLHDERLCNDRFKYDIERIYKGITHTQPFDEDQHTARICPVFFDSTPVTILVEIDVNVKIDRTYNALFESAAKIIEKKFSRDRVFTKKTSTRSMADAYYKLLCGERQDYFGVEFLEGKFDNDYHQYVAVCRLSEKVGNYVELLDSFEKIPCTSAFVYTDYAVAVTRVCSSCYSMLKKSWSQLSQEHNIDISVSEPFMGLKRLKRFFNEAVTALSYADFFRKNEENKVVCYYDDCRFFESMKRVPYQDLIDKYCAPAMHAVLKHDAIHGTEYFKSLRAFVYNDRNYKAAAAELMIHNNTMYYRISQIEKIYYDQTIWDPDFFFTMSYSFRLYDYCQMRIKSMGMDPKDSGML